MNAKEYLAQIDKIFIQIANVLEKINRWKDIANNTSACMSGERVQSSEHRGATENAICTYMDMERESLAELNRRKEQIFNTLKRLPQDEYYILSKIYVQKQSLKVICIEKKKSYSWATTTHRKALNNLQKILDAEKLRKENGK